MALVRVIVSPKDLSMNESDYMETKFLHSDYDYIFIIDKFSTINDLETFIFNKFNREIGNHLNYIVSSEPFISKSIQYCTKNIDVTPTEIYDGVIKSKYSKKYNISENDVIDVLISVNKLKFIKRD